MKENILKESIFLQQKYMKAMERQAAAAAGPPVQAVSEKKSIGGDNLGNKMLQRMGWKEGLGLGKDNQGRTSIIEVKSSFMGEKNRVSRGKIEFWAFWQNRVSLETHKKSLRW